MIIQNAISVPVTELSAPKAAEEMQRTRHVLQQEANRDQVEEDAEGARNAIMRLATLAVDVADRNLADGRAVGRSQRRNEAVQLAVERNFLDHFATIGLEGRAEVVQVHAA